MKKPRCLNFAKAIGFSKAYVYKFFDSKQAIGEVICTQCLNAILAAIDESMTGAETASERFRRLFKTIVKASVELFFVSVNSMMSLLFLRLKDGNRLFFTNWKYNKLLNR